MNASVDVSLDHNFVARILAACAAHPERTAVVRPIRWNSKGIEAEERETFGGFAERVARFQAGLQAEGFRQGDRLLVLFPPCVDLYALVVALLGLGMVPVFVDTGMSRARIIAAFRASGARGVVSVRALLRLWPLMPVLWRLRRYAVDGRALGVRPVERLRGSAKGAPQAVTLAPDTHGLITFTSGSTGLPKGADRTHGSLIAQHLAIRHHWPDQDGEVDLTCLPVVGLHNLSCGLTTVLPAVNLGAPATVEPHLVVAQIQAEGASRLAAAPAFTEKLARYVRDQRIALPTLRLLVVGGAPVDRPLAALLREAFPGTESLIAYGSTEVEPISGVTVTEYLTSPGEGHLVGAPIPEAEVAIVHLPADPAAITDPTLTPWRVAAGAVGEIVVRGPHVLRGYVDNPAATRENKIPGPDGQLWHRTGDTGYLDGEGRIWVTGRLKDQVQVNGRKVEPYPVEAALNALNGVARAAFISDAAGEPAAVLQLHAGVDAAAVFRSARECLAARELAGVRCQPVPVMPVDGRHNSKIDRVTLKEQISR